MAGSEHGQGQAAERLRQDMKTPIIGRQSAHTQPLEELEADAEHLLDLPHALGGGEDDDAVLGA